VVSRVLVVSLKRTVMFRLSAAVVGRLMYTPSRNHVRPALISCKQRSQAQTSSKALLRCSPGHVSPGVTC